MIALAVDNATINVSFLSTHLPQLNTKTKMQAHKGTHTHTHPHECMEEVILVQLQW